MNYFYSYKIILLSGIIIFYAPRAISYPALVTVPIADLVGSPVSSDIYQQLPLCGATNFSRACPRLHQALFNQYVEVIQERNGHVCIQVPNVFYITHQSQKPYNQFWTAACTITPVRILEKENIKLSTFPAPINYTTKTIPEHHIVTLIEPLHDAETGFTFSAGTRFVLAQKADAHTISVYRYNPKQKKVTVMQIPKKQCYMSSPDLRPEERVHHFVALARRWARKTDGAIPYVWGGCSYIQRSKPDAFKEVVIHTKEPYAYYVRPDCTDRPASGIDCSGFICLAAQCCGIPYFFKNSTTVARCLRPVAADESIIEGDIIWIPNHVMIVGSVKNNTLIEARHYSQGYGCVHELPLSAVFKDITTYHDLHQACLTKKPLVRLDRQGNARETIRECKLLHIMSAWADAT